LGGTAFLLFRLQFPLEPGVKNPPHKELF
jgi:hypothetical protein